MSEVAVAVRQPCRDARAGSAREAPPAAARPDARRALQLGLAAIWLLDGVLQYQPFMYTKAFGQMLAATAAGQPVRHRPADHLGRDPGRASPGAAQHDLRHDPAAARPRHRVPPDRPARPRRLDRLVARRVVVRRGARRGAERRREPAQRRARRGDHLRAARGAALARRPAGQRRRPSSPPGRSGAHVARALWLVLWLSLAYFALTPANRAPQAVNGMIASMESGEPGWLAAIDARRGLARRQPGAGRVGRARRGPRADRRRGLPARGRAARATLVLAIVVAARDLGRRPGVRRDPRLRARPTPTPGRCSCCSRWPTGRPRRSSAGTGGRGRPRPLTQKGSWPDDPGLDSRPTRRPHARGRGGERGPARGGPAVAARIGHHRHRHSAPADGHRHGGHAGAEPAHPARTPRGRSSSAC